MAFVAVATLVATYLPLLDQSFLILVLINRLRGH